MSKENGSKTDTTNSEVHSEVDPDDSLIHISLATDAFEVEELVPVSKKESLVQDLVDAACVPDDKRLDVQKKIARGGVAAIWRTADFALGRSVALKLMHEKAQGEPILVHGFFREAQVNAQLNHPNVVPVHEMGAMQGRPFFTMGLAEGESLTKWFKNHKTDNYEYLADFLEIMTKVSDALVYAHSRGVIHCDLKPDNIMVGSYGEVYVLDWGGAQLLGRSTGGAAVKDRLPPLPTSATEGKVFGTPAYMPPEQARGQKPTKRWDVFSLGAIIYRFVSGRPPIIEKDAARAIAKAQHCMHEPLNEEKYGNSLPRELLKIVSKAMSKDPADRYPGIGAMKNALTGLLRGGSTFPIVEIPKGTEVICEGDLDKTAYIVREGQLEAFKMKQGSKVSLRILEAGDVFGEMAMFASAARTASVTALSDVKLLKITEDVLRSELDSMSPWMATFVRTLAARFAERENLSSDSPVDDSEPSSEVDIDIPAWYRS